MTTNIAYQTEISVFEKSKLAALSFYKLSLFLNDEGFFCHKKISKYSKNIFRF